jgi:hypothetical protein
MGHHNPSRRDVTRPQEAHLPGKHTKSIPRTEEGNTYGMYHPDRQMAAGYDSELGEVELLICEMCDCGT